MPHRAIPAGDHWQMQYRRMLRSRERMRERYSSTENHDDAVYHFFQDAWHLKDWVKRDPAVPKALAERIETDLEVSLDLLAAADVANGSKHLEFSARYTPRVGARIFERELAVGGQEGVKHTHRILVGQRIVTADELADRVISEWNRILRGYGLFPEA